VGLKITGYFTNNKKSQILKFGIFYWRIFRAAANKLLYFSFFMIKRQSNDEFRTFFQLALNRYPAAMSFRYPLGYGQA
jgi:hypothetical protein